MTCEISGAEVFYHFVDINKMIELAKGAQMSFQIMHEENETAINMPVHLLLTCKLTFYKE